MITFEQYANHDCHQTAEDSCNTCVEWGYQVHDLYEMQKNLESQSHGMVSVKMVLNNNMFSANRRNQEVAQNIFIEDGELVYAK